MDENNIIHMVMHDNVVLDLEDAMDNALVIRNLSKGNRVLKLIDSRANWTIEKKAREFLNSKEVKDNTIARAVVKSSVVNSKLINFFIKLNKPQFPTKIFTDYEEAYQWLLEIKQVEDRASE
jgi:hypothetical protein